MPKLSGIIVYKKDYARVLYACTVAFFLESYSAIYLKSLFGIFNNLWGL